MSILGSASLTIIELSPRRVVLDAGTVRLQEGLAKREVNLTLH